MDVCSMFSSILGLYPQEVSSDNQMCPDIAKCPWVVGAGVEWGAGSRTKSLVENH